MFNALIKNNKKMQKKVIDMKLIHFKDNKFIMDFFLYYIIDMKFSLPFNTLFSSIQVKLSSYTRIRSRTTYHLFKWF